MIFLNRLTNLTRDSFYPGSSVITLAWPTLLPFISLFCILLAYFISYPLLLLLLCLYFIIFSIKIALSESLSWSLVPRFDAMMTEFYQ